MPRPRRWRGFCSPITQRSASITFDLPQPLGPTIAEMPRSNANRVLSAKDLKPTSSRERIRNRAPPLSIARPKSTRPGGGSVERQVQASEEWELERGYIREA